MLGLASRLLRSSGDQGQERMRRAYLSAITSIGSRLGSIGVLLFTVPLANVALGPERFGMWMVISSVGAVMAFADLGIGNGIINLVANALGRDDAVEMRTIASSAFVPLTLLGLLMFGGAAVAYPFLDWASVFRVTSPQAVREAGPSILVFLACFAVGLPASIGPKMQLGLQQGYIANLWTGLGGMASLVAVLLALWLGAGVPLLVLAMFGSQQLMLVLNTLFFFLRDRRDLMPARGFVRGAMIRRLFRLGVSFFVLQFVAVAVFRLDALFVTQFFGPEDAGTYATVERIFSLIAMVVGLYLAPLWPAYGEAASRGDRIWIKKTLYRSTLIAVVVSAMMVVALTILYPWILAVLLHHSIAVPLILILGFGTMKILEAIGNGLSMFLNGLGVVDAQVLFAMLMASVAIVAKISIGGGWGISAFIWITVLCYIGFSICPLIYITRKTLHRMT